MLIRSIYGETPEGAVPVEDRGPNKEKCEKHFAKQSKLGWGPNREKCEAHFTKQKGFQKERLQAKQVGVPKAIPLASEPTI